MKNVQIIDGAENTEYAVHAFTDEEFAFIFPKEGQNIEFIEDVLERMTSEDDDRVLTNFINRKLDKTKICGIHGTLFFELSNKRIYYPTKKDSEMPGVTVSMKFKPTGI